MVYCSVEDGVERFSVSRQDKIFSRTLKKPKAKKRAKAPYLVPCAFSKSAALLHKLFLKDTHNPSPPSQSPPSCSPASSSIFHASIVSDAAQGVLQSQYSPPSTAVVADFGKSQQQGHYNLIVHQERVLGADGTLTILCH